MKKHLFKYTLILLFSTFSTAAVADGDENYLVNEDFSTFPSGASASYTPPNGWTISGGRIWVPSNSSNIIYKIENMGSSVGYATTRALGYAGNVKVSFRYGTNKESSTIVISVNSSAKFDNNKNNKEVSMTNRTDENLLSTSCIITGVTTSTKITFKQKTTADYFYLDDVKIIKLGEITLNDQINSSEAIAVNAGTSCTVNLKRTLKENIWNTLCLPFDVNMNVLEGAFGTDKGIQLRVFDEYDGTTSTMKFKTPDNGISAGTPFLIKVNAEIKDPTFTGVTISNVAAQSNGNDDVCFVGTYGPKDLATDGTNLFITTANELAMPTAAGNTMPGLRAYIVVPTNFNTSNARLLIDGEATAIVSASAKGRTAGATLYNLQGQRVRHPRSGLYIQNNKLTIIK